MKRYILCAALCSCLVLHNDVYAQVNKSELQNKSAYLSDFSSPSSQITYGFWDGYEVCIGLYGLSGFHDIDMGGYIGRFFSNLYIEGYMSGGLKKAEIINNIEDQSINGLYQSLNYGCNLGLGFHADDCVWKFIPYFGLGFQHAISSRLDAPYYNELPRPKSGFGIVMNAGIRTSYLPIDWFEVFIAPEYRFTGIGNTTIYSLNEASKTIRSWGNGFRLCIGVGINFL